MGIIHFDQSNAKRRGSPPPSKNFFKLNFNKKETMLGWELKRLRRETRQRKVKSSSNIDEFTREGQFLYSLTMYFLLAV